MHGTMDRALAGVTPLTAVTAGSWAQVVRVEAPDEEARWLAALGLGAGQRVQVLRRAVLGGPLHVRTGQGGAFALGAPLAQRVAVRLVTAVAAA